MNAAVTLTELAQEAVRDTGIPNAAVTNSVGTLTALANVAVTYTAHERCCHVN